MSFFTSCWLLPQKEQKRVDLLSSSVSAILTLLR
jgi:hypothetical protein